MSLKEQVVQEVERLSFAELQSVAEYVSFLKFRAQAVADNALESLYGEFTQEDREMAQADLQSYSSNLLQEDAS